MKSYNFLVTGVGGQGTVVASDIIAAVGLAAGYDVKKSDVLGLAVRGGSVVSHIRWGEQVRSPIVPEGQVDVLIAFELLEGLRWLDQLKPEATVVINQQKIFPVMVSAGVSDYPAMTDTKAGLLGAAENVYLIPGLDLAQEVGNTRTLNVVLLGALSVLTDTEPEMWVDVIKKRVPAKAVDVNMKAFEKGRAVVKESLLTAETEMEEAA